MSASETDCPETEVLLVEDNPSDAELTLRALRGRHAAEAIVHVEDGEEALEFLRCEGRFAGRPSAVGLKVVVLDLKLPKVDGLAVLRAMKSDARLQTIPVVIFSSSREESDTDAAYRLGVNSFVVKPVEFDRYSEAVAKLGTYWLTLNEPPPRGSQ